MRLTYEVYAKSQKVALKKAVNHLHEVLPFVGDEDTKEQDGLMCVGVAVEQNNLIWGDGCEKT